MMSRVEGATTSVYISRLDQKNEEFSQVIVVWSTAGANAQKKRPCVEKNERASVDEGTCGWYCCRLSLNATTFAD
jgi:hypothetical protein